MSELGPVGVGLSVAFAVFLVIVAWEVYYIWTNWQRKSSEADEASRRAAVATVLEVADEPKWATVVAEWLLTAKLAVVRSKQAWWEKLCFVLKHNVKIKKRGHEIGREIEGKQRHDIGVGVLAEEVAESDGELKSATTVVGDADEEDDDYDIFKTGGLWGPPRLLFTITEETKEEMEMVDESRSASRGGKTSRKGSRASSELVLFSTSTSSSPYATPPSSPPFATPFGSPVPPHLLILKPNSSSIFAISDLDGSASSSSTSTSCGSSSTSSSASPLPNHFPLASLFEDSSSPSATPTPPQQFSPPPSFASPKRQHRRSLALLLDPPPSPSTALYHSTRVHPLSPSSPCYHRRIDILDSSPPPRSNSSAQPAAFKLPALTTPSIPSPFRLSSQLISATSTATTT